MYRVSFAREYDEDFILEEPAFSNWKKRGCFRVVEKRNVIIIIIIITFTRFERRLSPLCVFCDDDDDDASSKRKKKRDDEKQKRKKKNKEDLRVRFRVVRDGHGISGRPKRPKLFKRGGHPSK